MSFITRHMRLLLVGVTCLAAGAGASAIASAGASTGSAGHSAHARMSVGGLRRLARRAVRGSIVVSTPAGFRTVTFDRGRVESLSGNRLTIQDGTAKATYRTVTVTIPATARIRDNRQAVPLSSITAGQRVMVIQAPRRTLVIAHTPRHG